ncbi:MAG TPA: 16S rRNA (guanine(966)-N(2))-methyltransferase RsmD [Blastocatellia bacterium]|nr:16S rRNA (guanine(966)-N(2))-methyltransferase RsmD [Blastocatellia bacterium]
MRVIAGRYKGRRLKSPPGLDVRPTPDRLKESLFNILQDRLPGSRFLDLCAGTGSAGIEALSRGATFVLFVERSRAAVAVLRENLRALNIIEGYDVYCGDALVALEQLIERGDRFDIVFFDPPYASNLYEPVMSCLGGGEVLAPGGILIVMHHRKMSLEPLYGVLERTRQVIQGENVLSFYVISPEPDSRVAPERGHRDGEP